jgi:hypothetical protein
MNSGHFSGELRHGKPVSNPRRSAAEQKYRKQPHAKKQYGNLLPSYRGEGRMRKTNLGIPDRRASRRPE